MFPITQILRQEWVEELRVGIAANPAPGPARATSGLKPHVQARNGIRCMPTSPHPYKGQDVQVWGAHVLQV
ncbi:hypothetical protein QJQ45_017810 [Haematococcus lacustris]|nr:hypothetical protein QJQ45_017810 [Haematococcus lacustris]